ncbi:MAG: ThuA domain-containing protein [Bryobacterales bacterium]|nr:ThuA domain-containing protein [Bryobacterales bacterium]
MAKIILPLAAGVMMAVSSLPAHAAGPIKVMLLDGESGGPYHKWQLTTIALRKELEEAGLFQVDVVTAPPSSQGFGNFHPQFEKYQVIVSNYDALEWPAELKTGFDRFVKNGGGLVVVHAADNAFPGWKEYNRMIGVGGWRGRNQAAGPHWFFQGGRLASDASPGNAGGHGARVPFSVVARDGEHPILRGLPNVWMHQGDELYNSLRGPGEHMTVLATAFSDPANKGTGKDEPVLIVLTYGRGRIFHTTLGHDINALSCVGFLTTLQRGTEWAATGRVTQKVPANFPAANSVTYRTDIAAIDPNYKRGLNGLDAGH